MKTEKTKNLSLLATGSPDPLAGLKAAPTPQSRACSPARRCRACDGRGWTPCFEMPEEQCYRCNGTGRVARRASGAGERSGQGRRKPFPVVAGSTSS